MAFKKIFLLHFLASQYSATRLMNSAQGIPWVKGSVCFGLKFAFPSLYSPSPLLGANFKTNWQHL